MRLTCPNCRAQYDVPDTAIPEDGRDVECSNCAHSWFQSPDPGPGPLTLGEEALVPPNAPPPR
ncbi:MAG: zinc-ribbon domain-containing protein, partial [Primorskyibacter sp.]